MGQKYTSVSIPNELLHEIDLIVKDNKFGYTSKSEFIKESIRLNILRVKKVIGDGV